MPSSTWDCSFSANVFRWHSWQTLPWHGWKQKELCLINVSQREKKKSSANFPLLLPRHLLGMARRGSRGTGEFSFHDSFIPGLLCGNSQQVVDWWQLSWRVCDVDTQTISILHKSHSRAFPLQVSKTRAVSKPEKPHLCFLTNPHLNHLSVCCLFNVYVLW